MKGGEGWFLVVLSITVCMPDIYIDRVKGDGFFSFRFSIFNYMMFMLVYAYQRAQTRVRMYIIMCTCINYSLICNQMLKSWYF